MDLTKILDKGWINVIQTIVTIIAVIVIIIGLDGSGADNSIREEVGSIREHLDTIEGQNNASIELVTGVIDSNERVVGGLNRLSTENKLARGITTELGDDNRDHARRIRLVQDRSLQSEFVTDELKQIIRGIERDNNYNRD